MTLQPSLRLSTGFETTYLPGADVDCAETTGHAERWRADLDAVAGAGLTGLRYPVRWHRVEQEQGRYDWAATDAAMGHLRDRGLAPTVDLVHHTSYPRWLTDGFWDARFADAYLRFAEAVAARYPWLTSYTLFNEPFATLFLSGHQGLWPPYGSGMAGLARAAVTVLPAVAQASTMWRDLLPDARHVWVDSCEHHQGEGDSARAWAALCNDRRFVLLDAYLGHDLDLERPALRALVEAGGEALLQMAPGRLDVLGVDYYAHSEWAYDERGGTAPSPVARGLAAVVGDYAERYDVPLALTETNVRGFPSDRASWLRYTLEQCELARSSGVPLESYCWFPWVDSCDWDSLLARGAGRLDPVGVVSVEPDRSRTETSMTRAFRAAAAGAAAAELPAYRFQSPVAERLAGLLPQMAHWPWQDPPADEVAPSLRAAA